MSSKQISDVFAQITAKLTAATAELPLVLGNEAVNYSLNAFRSESWDGVPWQKRKSKKDANRNLLVKSGRGRRSIRIIRTTASSVTIGSDVPYMKVHNNGGTINRAARSETFVRNRYTRGDKTGKFKKGTTQGKGLSFKAYSYDMPTRQFIGKSRPFELAMRQAAFYHLQKAIR